jgi:hypothetical protein
VSIAKDVKHLCESVGRDGASLSKGVLWQHKRLNARPFYFHAGRLLAEQREPKSGYQTDALYHYTDGSLLVVHREAESGRATLAATNGD